MSDPALHDHSSSESADRLPVLSRSTLAGSDDFSVSCSVGSGRSTSSLMHSNVRDNFIRSSGSTRNVASVKLVSFCRSFVGFSSRGSCNWGSHSQMVCDVGCMPRRTRMISAASMRNTPGGLENAASTRIDFGCLPRRLLCEPIDSSS